MVMQFVPGLESGVERVEALAAQAYSTLKPVFTCEPCLRLPVRIYSPQD